MARDQQEDDMPGRKAKAKAAADTGTKGRAEARAAADRAAAATVRAAAEGAADTIRGKDEAAAAATYSTLSDAAARRGARDADEGAAALSMADEVAAGGVLAAALSADEFRRGMERAGISGQVQVAAELLRGVPQPTLAAFLSLCRSRRARARGPVVPRLGQPAWVGSPRDRRLIYLAQPAHLAPGSRFGGGWHGRSPLFSMPACVTFGGTSRRLAQNGPMPPSRF